MDYQTLRGILPQSKVHPTGVSLGHGSYGDVVEVEYKGKKFAAKIYRHASPDTLMKVFGREQQILALTEHPNILTYYGVCKLASDNTTVIVMERMERNLGEFLDEKQNVTLMQKCWLLCGIAKGLNYLHTQQPAIIHRDLTATNVLLNSKGVAKIGDFGNSRTADICATPELLTSNPGTLDYMPPEALEGGEYDEKLDIFSFGHLLIYVLSQHRPHPLPWPTYREHGRTLGRSEVERRVKYLDNVKTKLPGGEQHELYSLIIRCLQNEPQARPSCADILASNTFATILNNS